MSRTITLKRTGIEGLIRKGGEWSRSAKSNREIVDVCFSKHTDIRGSQNKRSFSWTEVVKTVRDCNVDLAAKGEGTLLQLHSKDKTMLLIGKVFRDPDYQRTEFNEWGIYLITVVKVELEKGVYKSIRVDDSRDSVIVKAGEGEVEK